MARIHVESTPALHADFLALQIRDAANALIRKQFEAADVHACHDRDGLAGIDRTTSGGEKCIAKSTSPRPIASGPGPLGASHSQCR